MYIYLYLHICIYIYICICTYVCIHIYIVTITGITKFAKYCRSIFDSHCIAEETPNPTARDASKMGFYTAMIHCTRKKTSRHKNDGYTLIYYTKGNNKNESDDNQYDLIRSYRTTVLRSQTLRSFQSPS